MPGSVFLLKGFSFLNLDFVAEVDHETKEVELLPEVEEDITSFRCQLQVFSGG